jgi:hypothetical protein
MPHNFVTDAQRNNRLEHRCPYFFSNNDAGVVNNVMKYAVGEFSGAGVELECVERSQNQESRATRTQQWRHCKQHNSLERTGIEIMPGQILSRIESHAVIIRSILHEHDPTRRMQLIWTSIEMGC